MVTLYETGSQSVPANGRRRPMLLISVVSDRDKALIWNDVLVHFTLQTDGYDNIIDGDELKERVMDWAMKKMATQFQTWKKHLYTTYVKKNIAPDFISS